MASNYEHRDGSGSLFKNDKGRNEKRPDYRGSIKIAGVEYELAAWLNEGKNGKYMSLNAKPKGERQERTSEPKHETDPNDEQPF